jgi:hypothetical protein
MVSTTTMHNFTLYGRQFWKLEGNLGKADIVKK